MTLRSPNQLTNEYACCLKITSGSRRPEHSSSELCQVACLGTIQEGDFQGGLNSTQSLGRPSRTALVMASETLWLVADRGYFQSEEFQACHDADITAYVPKTVTF